MKHIIIILSVVLLSLGLYSCNKDNNNSPEPEKKTFDIDKIAQDIATDYIYSRFGTWTFELGNIQVTEKSNETIEKYYFVKVDYIFYQYGEPIDCFIELEVYPEDTEKGYRYEIIKHQAP